MTSSPSGVSGCISPEFPHLISSHLIALLCSAPSLFFSAFESALEYLTILLMHYLPHSAMNDALRQLSVLLLAMAIGRAMMQRALLFSSRFMSMSSVRTRDGEPRALLRARFGRRYLRTRRTRARILYTYSMYVSRVRRVASRVVP